MNGFEGLEEIRLEDWIQGVWARVCEWAYRSEHKVPLCFRAMPVRKQILQRKLSLTGQTLSPAHGY